MCKSNITLKKFIKLLSTIYTYKLIIFVFLMFMGYETLCVKSFVRLVMPVWGFNSNFVSCFLGFWLTIPFWNLLIHAMTKKQHLYLTALLLCYYTFLGSIPKFTVTFNYITWFGIIYLIASYIRLYPSTIFTRRRIWAVYSLITILLSMGSVMGMHYIVGKEDFYFVNDSNRILAVAVAVTTFLWFKNIPLPYNKTINLISGTTFGIFLIHTNSEAMRQWLWKGTLDCVGHFYLPLLQLALYCVSAVLAIFVIGSLIDRLRQIIIEEPFMKRIE